MFTRLRVKLALQFAALVFGLMLVLGAVFLAIEYTDINRQLDRRLKDQNALVQRQIRLPMTAAQATRLHAAGINARIVAAADRVLYTSDIFARVHAPARPAGFTTLRVDGSSFRVLTTPSTPPGVPPSCSWPRRTSSGRRSCRGRSPSSSPSPCP